MIYIIQCYFIRFQTLIYFQQLIRTNSFIVYIISKFTTISIYNQLHLKVKEIDRLDYCQGLRQQRIRKQSMKKNKNNSSNKQPETFDIMLSEEDYERALSYKNLYDSALETNKVLQQELETYKLNFAAIKKQGEQLVKKVMKLTKRIISLEEENQKLKEQKQQMIKQKSTLLTQNKKLLESLKQIKSSKQRQDELRKQVQKLTNELNQKDRKYTQIQTQNNNIHALNRNIQEQLNTLQTLVKQLKQQNSKLSTGYQALTKRTQTYESRCQLFQQQMSSQLNVQRVISHKYAGLKQAFGNTEDISRAMEELIKTYHEALDSGYAKILEMMFNQQ